MNKGRRLIIGKMDKAPLIVPKETSCRLIVGVKAKNLATLRRGYIRIEHLAGGAASFAALSSKTRIWRTRGANMAQQGEFARERQRRPKPPMAES